MPRRTTGFTEIRGNVLPFQTIRMHSVVATSVEAYHLHMRRLHPECSDSEFSDRPLPADILLREEPEDEEEEDDRKEEDDEEDDDCGDEGYSE